MLYPRVLLITSLVAPLGCGDNKAAPSDGGTGPDGDGGAGATCSLELEPSALDGGTWDPRFTIPGFTRTDGIAPFVFDFARDRDGSIVAAGSFGFLGPDHVEPLLRWKNGAWMPARTTWELKPPGAGFSAVAIDPNGRLALATYDDFGERSGEIWLDDGTGLRVIGTFDGLIRTLTWYDDELWAAGFDVITSSTTPVQGLAVWNGTSWTPPPGGALDGYAFELVHDGDELLVGGAFGQIGGIPAANVAAYDGTSWRALDFPNVSIYALARDASNELYAGGTFGDVFGATGGIAHWTGTGWELAAGGLANRAIVGVVTDLAQHAGSLYVSGCFLSAGGDMDNPDAVVTRNVARLDAQGTWHALDDDTKGVFGPWLEPLGCGDEGPDSVWNVSRQRMASAGSSLLLGGSFPGIAGVLSQSMIAYDGSSWVAQGPSGLGIAGSLDRIATSGDCDVWGLGQLTHAGGVATRSRVVHFTGTDWEPIADSIPRDASCPGLAVSKSGEVSVGCMLFPEGGDPVGRIYRVSGSELVQVGGDMPLVQVLAYDADGRLWVGGGAATGYVGRLDGTTLTMIEEGFDAPVSQLDPVTSTDIIVGGYFTKIGTRDAAHIARWNGTTWQVLGAGLPASPTALTHDATKVYASTANEGAGQLLLGAFDGTTWTELATPTSGLTAVDYFNFNALRVVGDAIVAVGSATLDDQSGRGALVYRGGTFRPLGGGVGAIVLSGLAVTSDAVWVGGAIGAAGPASQTTSTIGVARYVIAK